MPLREAAALLTGNAGQLFIRAARRPSPARRIRMNELCYRQMPQHGLVVLIGPSGAGKTTIANTWPASQVLSLDALRETVNDDFSVKSSVLS